MTTPPAVLRVLPKRKNAIQPRSMRWLKHIYDIYNEVDSTLLARPEAIEAFNRLYDRMDTYKYAFLMEYPPSAFRYELGILPFRYTADTIYSILHAIGEKYTEEEINELDRESNRNIPYYIQRFTAIYPDGKYRVARMCHQRLSSIDIMRQLGVDTLEGTVYMRDSHEVLRELTELYINLFNTVKDVLEPAILRRRIEVYRKKYTKVLEERIFKKNAERIRLEEKYKSSLLSIETELDRMYNALEHWNRYEEKKEDV